MAASHGRRRTCARLSPEALASFADLYRPGSEGTRPTRCPELRVVAVKGDDDAVFERMKTEVNKALKNGAKPGDIAILSLVGQSKSELFKAKRIGDVALVRADAPDAPTTWSRTRSSASRVSNAPT